MPLVFWLGIWEAVAVGVGQELLLPTPFAVLERIIQLAATVEFWETTAMSLLNIFGGIVAGTAIGLIFAWLTSVFAVADWVLTPIIKIVRATPIASFIILTMLWVAKVYIPGFMSALMVIPIIWGNVIEGVRMTDRELLEAAKIYRFGKLKTFRLVYVPSVMPYFSSGLITSLGLAWKSGVAAEVLCQPKNSIGTELFSAKLYLETPSLFAWTFVIILLSFIIEKLVVIVLKNLIKIRKGSTGV